MVEACNKYGERCVQVLVGKPEGRRMLGRRRRRSEDNNKNGYSKSEMGTWTE
jgi:hypothetical protein